MSWWCKDNPPNHLPEEIPDPLDDGQRSQDKQFELRLQFEDDLRTLGFDEELYRLHEHDTYFVAIVGLALMDPLRPLTYYQAEQIFFELRAEGSKSESEISSGQVYTAFKGINFGQTSRLKKKMWDEAA